MKIRFPILFKNDPWLRTSLAWGLGLASMVVVVNLFIRLSFTVNGVRTAGTQFLESIVPCFFALFGAAYMVRFVGRRPIYYTAMCGVFLAFSLALFGLISELISSSDWSGSNILGAFLRFLITAVVQGIILAVIGGLAGWVVTRGRTPIEIELPDKKEIETAKKEGRAEPTPRIVTPLSAMPGSLETNKALLEQLENDPESLLPEKERKQRARNAAKAAEMERKRQG